MFHYYIPANSKYGISNNTQNFKIQSILNFIRYCIENVLSVDIESDKRFLIEKYNYQIEHFKNLYAVKGNNNSRIVFRSLTDEQVEKLTDMIHPGNKNNPFDDERLKFRNALIIYILLETGIRIGELLLLRTDISLKKIDSNFYLVIKKLDPHN